MDAVKRQLDANYGQQLHNLNEKLLSNQELNKKEITLLNQHLESEKREKDRYDEQVLELQQKVTEQNKVPAYVWVLIIVALILGFLAGGLLIHIA